MSMAFNYNISYVGLMETDETVSTVSGFNGERSTLKAAYIRSNL